MKGYPAIFQYIRVNPCGWVFQAELSFLQLYLLCQSSLWLLCTQVSSSGTALGYSVVSDASLTPYHGQSSAWAVISSCHNFPPVCVGDRTCSSLLVVFGPSEPYPWPKSNSCSSILAQVPQELALIYSLGSWVCLLCPLPVVLGEQTWK